MPGIHTFLRSFNNFKENNCPFVPEEETPHNEIKAILQDNAANLYVTYYEGYPFSLWQTENQIILLEGMIYNQSKDRIETQLKAISQCFYDNYDYNQLVRAFVESADGDFIVEIWDNHKKRLLLFNNYWGRLPLYYYCLHGNCGISRDIKDLLSFAPEIEYNKTSLVEFLYFEFSLGNKTLFNNIYRLGPASMIVVDVKENDIVLKVSQTAGFTFDLNNSFASHSEGIEVLKELFLQSVQSRVQTLEGDEFQIATDLSGGFDSRAVLGGLEKFTHDVTYCTQTLNTSDQRKWGKAVFEVMGSPGKFVTAAPDYSYEFEKLGDFVFQYDCLANFSVGYTSKQVITALRELVPEKAARFLGMGGSEFLRHPLKAFRKSLIYGTEHGFYFYSNISLPDVCRLVGISYDDYHRELEEYLKSYPEQTSMGQLKRLYFEYSISAGDYGEDYCRKYFWTVCPLWGTMFMRAIVEQTPLEWTGFKYFTQFMKAVDPRLLNVPIFGINVNLNSEWSIYRLELKQRLKTWIKASIPIAHHILDNIQSRMNDSDQWKKIEPALRDITFPLIQSTLPQGQLKMNGGNLLISRRYLTLLLYFREIEKHFSKNNSTENSF
jgi:hypothetical protein